MHILRPGQHASPNTPTLQVRDGNKEVMFADNIIKRSLVHLPVIPPDNHGHGEIHLCIR